MGALFLTICLLRLTSVCRELAAVYHEISEHKRGFVSGGYFEAA
jgi:hypothetical protein